MNDPSSEPWTEADDIIEEVREIRRRISARFDDDPAKLAQHYMELQQRSPHRVVDPRTWKRGEAGA